MIKSNMNITIIAKLSEMLTINFVGCPDFLIY